MKAEDYVEIRALLTLIWERGCEERDSEPGGDVCANEFSSKEDYCAACLASRSLLVLARARREAS